MLRFLIICALACASPLIVGGCVPVNSASTVTIPAHKAFIVAQVAFKTMQEAALAGIRSGVISGQIKNDIIDLIAKGQGYENAAYAGDVTAVRKLTDVVAALQALGLKGN